MDGSVPPPPRLFREKHAAYIVSTDSEEERMSLEYVWTDFLRASGMYWGLTALVLLGEEDAIVWRDVVPRVMAARNADGGFGGAPGHDSHLLYTLSSLQVLALAHALPTAGDAALTAHFIAALQQDDGSFAGDSSGEIDSRFVYCAVASLALLRRLDLVDTEAAALWVSRCTNWDGGFAALPGAESHGGQAFTCVGALSILGRLDLITDAHRSAAWLAQRQTPSGGLNGRPQKKPDVCYSWWIVAALHVLRKLDWINGGELARFILLCQDVQRGGIADRPEDEADVFHTFFGVAGLSLLGASDVLPVCPVYALPERTVAMMGLPRSFGK
jgi:geranylgeranyl transferase type-2 subunit beta